MAFARALGKDMSHDFIGTDLTGYPLVGQDLSGVNLTGADLRGAVGYRQKGVRLESAVEGPAPPDFEDSEEENQEEKDKNAFWQSGTPPSWAEDWGWYKHGAWVTFRVESVSQRIRRTQPGRFLMG